MAARKPTPMASALTRSLRTVERRPEDAAAVALARSYARAIDDDPVLLWRVGPRLLEVLIELRMTPKARASVVTGGGSSDSIGGAGRSALDELRAKRDRRVHDA